ncbi:hypothetical protein B0T11DRAFT_322784 [Plectosphaerella cucumerina]|uniref:ADP-ribose 1''-phosphate phosphatase n=1 Tax=Plectosphaerella cucumerina TaxID=40658 RepID=A0A8K0X8K4_9PEZI|nr:hypothetical protein B0T11DRAFT_322784 [Plectosphaerella cucumerina]
MSPLSRIIRHLLSEGVRNRRSSALSRRYQQIKDHLDHFEQATQLQILQELLCSRLPLPKLPVDVLEDIDTVLISQRSQKVLTLADTIPSIATFNRQAKTRLALWRGDITTLTNITAIVNAANSQGLGCFQPTHRCIDNVIHSRAGPRLRDECHEVMTSRESDLPVGEAFVTEGYCLPAEHVVHVVGPQLSPGTKPTPEEAKQLASCYTSVLDAVETLPALESGRKIVAFCGISTGLFSFPAERAARIAVDTVCSWFEDKPESTITDIIFNTFTEEDLAIYQTTLKHLPTNWTAPPSQPVLAPEIHCQSIDVARNWLSEADTVLVSAGAGFSAATGLDYNSKALFSKYLPAFKKHGLSTLFSVFGFDGWDSEQDRWGYYFNHLTMVKQWPRSETYDVLLSWLRKFGTNAHVRTSNADGLFLAHDWPEEQLSTPQGSYAVLQCLDNCRPAATVPTEAYRKAALPFLDPVTQQLTNPEKVPLCRFCGGKMFICVRAGSWFNETPFKEGEVQWRKFRDSVREGTGKVVILELGVGMSTPGVLRWPNEELALRSRGNVKLVRLGMGDEAGVGPDLEAAGLGTSVNGDISMVIKKLLGEHQ